MPETVEIRYDDNGLVPCVAQDADTGAVLTLAYMNAEALAKTLETGDVWFYSRSREELWHKGATCGNFLRVRELRYDCDDDAILALVDPTGPACHTGERTCFYRGFDGVHRTAVRGARRAAGDARRAPRRDARGLVHDARS